MYLKLIGIILFICIFPKSYAQWLNRQEGNLKGMVKSFTLNHLKIISAGDSVWGEIAPDNDPFWFNGYIDESYLFDKNGRTIEYHTYFTEDADDNTTINRYHKNGKLSEQLYFADQRKNGKMKYYYDGKGRVTQITRHTATGRIADRIFHIHNPQLPLPLHQSKNNIRVYAYNKKGECTEEKSLTPNGRINFRLLYFYDEEGLLTQLITFDGKNQQQSTRHYKYDEKNRICSIRYVSSITCTVTNYWYDKNDNEIRCQITNVDLQELGSNKTVKDFHSVKEILNKYRYDTHGNWTERYLYINGIPQYMQLRELSYWE